MKRFNPELKTDDYGYHYIEMVESPAGRYVEAVDAFEENPDYEYSFAFGRYVKKERMI